MSPTPPHLPEGWPAPRLNRVLARVPAEEYERLLARLHPYEPQLREVIYAEGAPLDRVYFPQDCVFSLVTSVDDDPTVEVSTTGNEGVAGLPAFLGAATSPHRAFCQIPGRALYMTVAEMHEALADDGAFHRLLNRVAQGLIVELAQNVACNRLHSIEQRCAR